MSESMCTHLQLICSSGECGLSHTYQPVNFGHFLFEYLNRIAIFDVCGLANKFPVVVYDNLPDKWLGFLEMMGIPRERIIRVPVDRPPAYRKVWVSSACHYRSTGGFYHMWGAGLHWMLEGCAEWCDNGP